VARNDQRGCKPTAMRLSASANCHAEAGGSGSGLNIMLTLSHSHLRQGGQAAYLRNSGLRMVLLAKAIGLGWAVDLRRHDVAEAVFR